VRALLLDRWRAYGYGCAYDHIWQELYATEKAWLPAVLEPVQFTPPPHTILQLLSTPFTTPHHPLTRCVRPT
jgi:hypothetical protein